MSVLFRFGTVQEAFVTLFAYINGDEVKDTITESQTGTLFLILTFGFFAYVVIGVLISIVGK